MLEAKRSMEEDELKKANSSSVSYIISLSSLKECRLQILNLVLMYTLMQKHKHAFMSSVDDKYFDPAVKLLLESIISRTSIY